MLKIFFVANGVLLFSFWGCSNKQSQTNYFIPPQPADKLENIHHPDITYDFSIELLGEPIDTTGEIWNVRGIDIYWNDSPEPIQQIKNINTLTPVGDFSGGFMVDDYNFDSTADFRLIKYDRNTNEIKYLFWLFDKKLKKFIHCFPLDSIPLPQFDYEKRLIFSDNQTDSSVTSDSYKFIGGVPSLFEKSTKTVMDESVVVKHYKNENGKLILIKQETVSE